MLIPTTNRPPRPYLDPDHFFDYISAAYDARRDKLVLFGTRTVLIGGSNLTNLQPTVWEWDSANGWVNPTVTGAPAFYAAILFFDSQRGVLTALTGYPRAVSEWDGGSSWRTLTPLNSPPPTMGFGGSIGHDPVRGMSFVTFHGTTATGSPQAYVTVNPARFEALGSGCPGSAGEPTLRLTDNWTRAWLGRTLSVDLANLPSPSTGFVAIGWSNTNAGAISLPLPLAPFGMPGCFARVATDDIRAVAGGNGTATLTMPVPISNALVGVVLYQQGFPLDPLANAAGLAASNSVRITIGRL
jgi:hypothetical protein